MANITIVSNLGLAAKKLLESSNEVSNLLAIDFSTCYSLKILN